MAHDDVLIAGAGPTGLVLALWLTKLGIRVRIIDKTAAPVTTSRALAVQARTLELYRQLDLTEPVLGQAQQVPGINLWARGKKAARVSFEHIAEGLTPYGPCVFPQSEHEQLLVERLQSLGVSVERRTELLQLDRREASVSGRLRGPDGTERPFEARYVAGCDGAGSIVRHAVGTGFPGGTYQQLFYVADVNAAGPAVDGELHVDLDEADFLAIFPLKGSGRVRLVGTVRDARAEHPESLRFEDVRDRAIENMKLEVRAVNWFSTYRVHHRVAEHFRAGRLFLLGDAAHIHSPAGGQGMNTGIGDAINLAWKLAAVLTGQATEVLLDTYETERRAFARTLVATTDKGFSLATAQGPTADFVRTRIVPLIAPAIFHVQAARTFLFSAVSQILIAYRDSALSEGKVGALKGGDRLPWVRTGQGDNFDSFGHIGWQVHVYGTASGPLASWCTGHHIALQVYPWQSAYASTRLRQDALYLLRPDTYIALAAEAQDPLALQRYFAQRSIVPRPYGPVASPGGAASAMGEASDVSGT
jgi:2-polyprenyl-6-methoxyphenol hydroxylase-like FAD-dependent oxidoreductase